MQEALFVQHFQPASQNTSPLPKVSPIFPNRRLVAKAKANCDRIAGLAGPFTFSKSGRRSMNKEASDNQQ